MPDFVGTRLNHPRMLDLCVRLVVRDHPERVQLVDFNYFLINNNF